MIPEHRCEHVHHRHTDGNDLWLCVEQRHALRRKKVNVPLSASVTPSATAMQPRMVSAPARLRNNDVGPHTHSVEEVDHHVGDHTAHLHRRQRILVDQTADYQRVYAVVEVL